MSEQRSEAWCTNCSRQFIAILDLSLNGNHEIRCPLCGHIHYRVVRDGVVTEERYRSSAGLTYYAATSTTFNISAWSGGTGSSTIGSLWLNRSDLNLTITHDPSHPYPQAAGMSPTRPGGAAPVTDEWHG